MPDSLKLLKYTIIQKNSRGKEYRNEIEEKDGGIRTGTEKKQLNNIIMISSRNRSDPSPDIDYIVKEIIINSIIIVDNTITDIEDIPMK